MIPRNTRRAAQWSSVAGTGLHATGVYDRSQPTTSHAVVLHAGTLPRIITTAPNGLLRDCPYRAPPIQVLAGSPPLDPLATPGWLNMNAKEAAAWACPEINSDEDGGHYCSAAEAWLHCPGHGMGP
ncbi:hypothetical protein MGN70_013356 [Eutypa lata]|nr:hypothetical protein MGN70_013356 [Eutypa lata]